MNQLSLDLQPVESEYRLIPLSRGLFAKVDPEDYDWLMEWKWTAYWDVKGKSFYALRRPRIAGKRPVVFMARAIMRASVGVEIDHKNHDTLDNRKSINLRVATHAENSRNQRAKSRNKSGFKGVSWSARDKTWQAAIRAGGKKIFLGRFTHPAEAGSAYVKAAHEFHGDFACTELLPC